MARVKASDWQLLELEKWNTTTFHAWFIHQAESRYGIAEYIPFRNWSAEKRMLKLLIEKHGQAVAKEFLEVCLASYRPNGPYLHLTVGFAISYMQNPHLQRILMRNQQVQTQHTPPSAPIVAEQHHDKLEDWF